MVDKSSIPNDNSGLKNKFSYCSNLVPTENPVSLTLYPKSVKKSDVVAFNDVNNVLSVYAKLGFEYINWPLTESSETSRFVSRNSLS